MRSEAGSGRAPPAPPWQFVARATMVIAGLVLLLVVDVHGLVFFIAWALIVLALLSETAATVLHWRRGRGGADR